MRRLLPVLAALCALPLFAASAAIPETAAVNRGAAFLKSIHLPNGTYGTDSPGQNMDSIYAVRAAGFDPALDLSGGKSPRDYLIESASLVTSPGAGGKAALAAIALGLDPRNVNGVDFIAVVESHYDPATGAYADDDFTQSIAMIGLACTGNAVGAQAADALRETQLDDGGWGFGGFADADTTAIAIQALLASGVPSSDPAVQAALAYLKDSQGSDGGWGYDPTASNASSTAFAVQALLALGENPESATYSKNGVTPVAYLLSQQNPDGSFQGFDPVYSTNQVIPALAGKTYCEAPSAPVTQVRPPTTPAPATPAPLPPSTGETLAASPASELATALALALLVAALATGAAAFGLRKG
ncbi:MAG TPA: prenyltransferase/squalene oxidase repeat-containing protein [Tepidiformaceae bacterium]|nr:prenyltransferase/squalene oxidase repeat-containing protein [Tepidiformaceae bacterium]